jgi:hypothetical protein
MACISRQMTKALALALTLIALFAAPARPQVGPIQDSPPPPCTETQPPEIVSSWMLPAVATESGRDAQEARAHPLILGKPNRLKLVTGASARLPLAPGGAEQPKQYIYVGLAAFQIPKDGTYRVVTDEGMRIDVVADGKLVDSTAFGRGPHCSGKFVDFPLHAGEAMLQLVGAPYESVAVLILARP